MFRKTSVLRGAALGASLVMSAGMLCALDCAAQAPAPAAARQIGTIKSVAGNSVTLTTDAGQLVSVSVPEGAHILQLAPGSTNLKEAQAITLADIAVGDRVLVTGKAGDDASSLEASRVILMKSSAIAQKHATEQEDWQEHGIGGIVSAVDEATGAVTIAEGAKKVTVNTSSKTKFRRYAGDSVKFEDAKPGTLAQIQAGDQLRVRGGKSADGSIDAEEVVSGSFKNLAGVIASISSASNTLTLKDLATKKIVTVKVTGNSSVRTLPPRAAAMFAARAKGGAANGGEAQHTGSQHAGQSAGAGVSEGAAEERSAGMDLSHLVSRLPNETLSDLKVGDAVMIVASQPDPGSSTETAVTLLSGVEPILAATPSGTPAMTLSPWNMGGAPGDSSAQ
jgi:co-chaperonin GroES (HSP10)